MRVYTHYTQIENTDNGYRWRTLLQFGSSWEIIGSIVMMNPGGANFKYNDHHPETDENILSHLRKFDSEQSINEEWYEFGSDNTLNLVQKLFSERSIVNNSGELNGVIQVFNLFYLKDPNLSEGLALNDKLNMSDINDRIFEDDIQNLKAPLYLGFGHLSKNSQFKTKAKRFFDKAIHELGVNYLSPNFEENSFMHPRRLMLFKKNTPEGKLLKQQFFLNSVSSSQIDEGLIALCTFSIIAKKNIIENVISSSNLEAYEEKNHRYMLNDKYGITITDKEKGYIGIRHIKYDTNGYSNTQDKEVLAIREMLKGRGYNTSEKAWIGTKRFPLFGNNDKEITGSICKEIEEIKKEIQKFSLFLK